MKQVHRLEKCLPPGYCISTANELPDIWKFETSLPVRRPAVLIVFSFFVAFGAVDIPLWCLWAGILVC
jgi:hypothetical protein